MNQPHPPSAPAWLRGLALGLVAALGACGSPSNFDICHSTCDAGRRCGVLSDAQALNCHTTCDNNKGSLEDQTAREDRDCKNAGDVRRKVEDCNHMDCNKIASCAVAVDRTCVK